MAKLHIVGTKKILVGETGYLELTNFNDESMTAFFKQTGGDLVYLTYSDLKILKSVLVNMKDDAWPD